MKLSHSFFVRIVSLLLIIVFIIPTPTFAAVPETAEPAASYYLSAYTAYICPMGNGDLQIWWNVIGTGTMADIGVLTIWLYESTDNTNWTWIKTFRHTNYSQMLDHNTIQGMDYVSYQGIMGNYYKAYVTIHAGDGTNGDNRYFWTPVEQAAP